VLASHIPEEHPSGPPAQAIAAVALAKALAVAGDLHLARGPAVVLGADTEVVLDGRLLGKHRKLKPTAGERLIWGEGDGSTLTVVPTEFGRVGGLICWENYMPLARMAMYAKGVEIYLAPTADARESWQATLRHIACEGRCFVLGCNQFVTKGMYPAGLPGVEDLQGQPEVLCRGGSAIVSPLGEVLAGPLWDKEDLLVADLDLAEVARGKFDFDVVGHYARPDVFQLTVNEEAKPPVSVTRNS